MYTSAAPVLPLVITNLNRGAVTRLSDSFDGDGNPLPENQLYSDGTAWEQGEPNALWKTRRAQQIVLDAADVTDATANYLTFDVNVPVHVAVVRSDSIAAAYDASFTDNGHDSVRAQTNWSHHSRTFSAGTVTVPGCAGQSGDDMYAVFVLPAYRRVVPLAPPALPAGDVEFVSATYQVDDDQPSVAFQVRRINGTAGAASVSISILSGGAHGTLNTTTINFGDGDGGPKSGTFSPNNVTGDQVTTLQLSLVDSPPTVGLGPQTTAQIQITDVGDTGIDTEFYVNGQTGSPDLGDDGNDGLAPDRAWRTIGRANNVQPATGGHVVIHVEGGPTVYRGAANVWTPANDGLSNTQRIILQPRNGKYTVTGPTNGTMLYGFFCENRKFVNVARMPNGDCMVIDGLDPPTKFGGYPGNIKHIAQTDNTQDCVFEYESSSTQGWAGTSVSGANATRTVYGVRSQFHGNAFVTNAPNADEGDAFNFNQDLPESVRNLLHAEFTDTEWWRYAGHNLFGIFGGGGIARWMQCRQDYWILTGQGYGGDDGSRIGALGRNARRWCMESSIWALSGDSGEGERIHKMAGQENLFRCFVVRDGIRDGVQVRNNQAMNYKCRRNRHNNFVIHDVAGHAFDAGFGGTQGLYGDWKWYNGIAWGIRDNFLDLRWNDAHGYWADNVEIHNCMIEAGTPINIYNGTDTPGLILLNTQAQMDQLQNDWPGVFANNIIFPAGAHGLANPGSAVWLDTWLSDYAPNPGSLAENSGRTLTTATASGTNSTTLPVADIGWFPEPLTSWAPAPTKGHDAGQGGYTVWIEGVGRVLYTDAQKVGAWPAGEITLAAPASWANGARIGMGAFGGTPNIGAIW